MKHYLYRFYHSIFVRIYTGLILLCLFTAALAFMMLQGVSIYRVQAYKEDIASGPAYLVAEGVARQTTPERRQNWLNDAQIILNLDIKVIPFNKEDFSSRENSRLNNEFAVLKQDEDSNATLLFIKIPNENNLLFAKLTRENIREQQIKALPVFLLDDLVHHEDNANTRLAELQAHFPYDLKFLPFASVNLDDDQRARIKRKEIVLMFREHENRASSTLMLISPTEDPGMVLAVGAIPLFNWLPLQLVIGLSLVSLVVISFGVYGLIFPLHRKIIQLQNVVTDVRAGDFDARVKIAGQDEIATLGLSFNNMTDHIQRLINAQRELTRAVSHELRTPVARIRFGLEMLADTNDQASRFEQQASIDKDIETLNDLIDEILTYAKLEASTPSLQFESFSLYKLVQQVSQETNALGKPITVNVTVAKSKVTVSADYRYVHRVLQNLAGNAMRYANTTIHIRAGIQSGMAFISVEDDGPGIPEADYDKVFLPFARLDDSRTRASGGYGLGLSIASKIAYWFKGDIKVDKSPTLGGARFIMRWPVLPPKS